MHSSLTAVVLCIFAQAAAAQCVAAAPQDRDARMGAEMIKTAAIVPTSTAPVRQGGELIKSAAAGTPRAAPAGRREAALSVHDKADSVKSDDEHPPRSGTAMLLAALALMSGIALRRYGANPQ